MAIRSLLLSVFLLSGCATDGSDGANGNDGSGGTDGSGGW